MKLEVGKRYEVRDFTGNAIFREVYVGQAFLNGVWTKTPLLIFKNDQDLRYKFTGAEIHTQINKDNEISTYFVNTHCGNSLNEMLKFCNYHLINNLKMFVSYDF